VVSKAYDTACLNNIQACSGRQDFAQEDTNNTYWIDGGVHNYHTIEYRGGPSTAYEDEYLKTHKKLGHFMSGCKTAKQLPGQCKY